MPKLLITEQEFKNYRNGQRTHTFYAHSCEAADAMRVHADGLFPDRLLRTRRPNEPEQVFMYRKAIFMANTKAAFSKVFNSLQKIRRSNGWSIDYKEFNQQRNEFGGIPEGETMQDYCEEDFPHFASITNWLFGPGMRTYLIDANAVCVVWPLDYSPPENVFKKPFPAIFESKDVLDFAEEDYCFLRNAGGAVYYSGGKAMTGDSYYFINTERIVRFDQIDGRLNFAITLDYEHELGFMPAKKFGGVFIGQADNQFHYESRLSPMVPELDEAVREGSDLQAAKVLHIYPERWEYTNLECTNCAGTGKAVNPMWYDGCVTCGPPQVECETCHGTGFKNTGPYSKILVRPPDASQGATSIPTPPAGYVVKDNDIIKIMEDSVNAHIYKAYAALNFEFLNNTPLNQSGTAKEVDKDELNNTVNSFAEDLVKMMDFIYRSVAVYRYGYKYADKIDTLVPMIAVPVSFDLLGTNNAQIALAGAKTAGANPVLLNALESDYASKVFYSDPEVKKLLLLVLSLDPLPNILEADKVLRLTNNGIDQITYTVSSNIHQFVQRAIEENENFDTLDITAQRDIINGYAQEQIDAASAATAAAAAAYNDSGNGLYAVPGGAADGTPGALGDNTNDGAAGASDPNIAVTPNTLANAASANMG